MTVALDTSLFLRACRGQAVERTPIWVMRQAGRYLPEYRALREKRSFLDVCRTPELAAEATLQPIRRFDFDAAILFSDILIVAQAMGAEVEFSPGPVFQRRVEGPSDVDALRTEGIREATAFVPGAVRAAREQLVGRTPLIGFAGAPFTVATYLVEGGGSRNFERIRSMLFTDPACARALLGKLVDATVAYARAQLDAGADAIMLFDTHAGLLAPPEFEAFAAAPAEAVFRQLGNSVPRIYYSSGTAGVLPRIGQMPIEVAGVDHRIEFAAARRALGDAVAAQGNLDPAVLLSTPEVVRARASAVLESNGGRPGHIFNLGHGILPAVAPANVAELVRAVREWGPRT